MLQSTMPAVSFMMLFMTTAVPATKSEEQADRKRGPFVVVTLGPGGYGHPLWRRGVEYVVPVRHAHILGGWLYPDIFHRGAITAGVAGVEVDTEGYPGIGVGRAEQANRENSEKQKQLFFHNGGTMAPGGVFTFFCNFWPAWLFNV